jgi:hypothetical protein
MGVEAVRACGLVRTTIVTTYTRSVVVGEKEKQLTEERMASGLPVPDVDVQATIVARARFEVILRPAGGVSETQLELLHTIADFHLIPHPAFRAVDT